MVAVFACSAAYHLATDARMKAILRRFDHAAIYVKIAGTYTPFAFVKMGDAVGLALLGVVWAITAFGATAKLLWPERLVRTSYVLYLVQGWAVVAAFGSLVPAISSRVLILLVVGGCLYTVGVVFHLWEKLPYHNAIWHALRAGWPRSVISRPSSTPSASPRPRSLHALPRTQRQLRLPPHDEARRLAQDVGLGAERLQRGDRLRLQEAEPLPVPPARPAADTSVALPASLPVALPMTSASPSTSSRSSAIWKAAPSRSP